MKSLWITKAMWSKVDLAIMHMASPQVLSKEKTCIKHSAIRSKFPCFPTIGVDIIIVTSYMHIIFLLDYNNHFHLTTHVTKWMYQLTWSSSNIYRYNVPKTLASPQSKFIHWKKGAKCPHIVSMPYPTRQENLVKYNMWARRLDNIINTWVSFCPM